MGINFPSSPLVGDIWPNPAVAGQGQYTWDGEKWTAGATPASRASIYAAPFDAMAYNGMQINGSFDVSQEKGAAETAVDGYVVDGWRTDHIGSGVIGASQLAAGGVSGFPNRIVVRNITAQTTMLAGDVFIFSHLIEGYRLSRLGWGTANAQPLTIGFWTAHTKTGIYTVSLRNSALTRAYSATYTQNVSGTLEYKTITIPGETTGVWQATNGVGAYMAFVLACGASNTATTANAWVAAGIAAPGQVNALDSASNTFVITGVVALPGIEAPSAARSPLIMRPYDQELVTCQRYYQRFDMANNGTFVDGYAGSPQNVVLQLGMRPMRGPPTGSMVGIPTVANLSSATPSFTATGTAAYVSWGAPAVGRYYANANASGTSFILDARL